MVSRHYNEGFRSPAVDGDRTETINDTIGHRGDDVETTTLAGRAAAIFRAINSNLKVYPTLDDSVQLTTAAGAWTLGAFATIIPASTITSRFDLVRVYLRNISAQDAYELALYYGPSDTELIRIPFEGIAGGKIDHLPLQSEIIPANSRIRAKIAAANGGSETCEVKLGYFEYES